MFARMVLRSMRARRARLVLGLTAVTLGVAVATALATLSLQVGDDLARALRAAGPNFVVLPAGASWPLDLAGADVQPARAGLDLPDSALAALKTGFWRNNVLEAAPELALDARVDGVAARVLGTRFTCAVPVAEGAWTTGLARLRAAWPVRGRWPAEDAAEVALGRQLASDLGVAPGMSVAVAANGRTERWRVTGVVDAGGLDERHAWAPLARVQALAGRPGALDRVWLSALVIPEPRTPPPDPARDPRGFERYSCSAYPGAVARDLASHLPGAEVLPATETVAGEASVVHRLNLLMLLLALAALTASTLGLVSTTTATVVERRRELGLLRALGALPRQVTALLLGETALVSVAGGALGWLLGSLAAAAIRGRTFGTGSSLQLILLPLAIALSLAVALLGTAGPLRVADRIDPAEVLRG